MFIFLSHVSEFEYFAEIFSCFSSDLLNFNFGCSVRQCRGVAPEIAQFFYLFTFWVTFLDKPGSFLVALNMVFLHKPISPLHFIFVNVFCRVLHMKKAHYSKLSHGFQKCNNKASI